MAYSSRTRVATMSLVVMVAALSACGHFAVELLPAGEDGEGTGGGVDGGDETSISADGATDAPVDGRVDAGPLCEGPDCPGTYVSAGIGDDANPGTSEKPVKTVTRGIDLAQAKSGPQIVYIAGGHYDEKVTLFENVSLFGGRDCSQVTCTWARDTSKFATQIASPDFEGLIAPAKITRATILDGLTINGKSGAPTTFPGSVALTIDGGSPTIRDCRIIGGDANGTVSGAKRSVGLAILGAATDGKGALVRDNVIRGGVSNEGSISVLVARRPSASTSGVVAAEIKKNAIKGGQGASTIALLINAGTTSTLLVEDNDIFAGNATGAAAVGGAWGIFVTDGATIHRNRINAELPAMPQCLPAQGFCGGLLSINSTAVITSNVIRGINGEMSTAVLLGEGEGATAPTIALNGNTLDGAGTGGDGGSKSAAIVLRNVSGTNATLAKVRNNILLYGNNGQRYGVYEFEVPGKQAHLKALDNNDFWDVTTTGTSSAYHYWDGGDAVDYSFTNVQIDLKVPALTPTSNINKDPLFDKDSVHIASISPCANAGTTTEAPARDIDNDPRPKTAGTPVDIGADEVK